ncbi:hypothetical protein [Pollutibacter soli]|uniref:hypothetical protein n=1 Tax=Pollutibacter soli TaxID=3034157 RepID=UPI0030134323
MVPELRKKFNESFSAALYKTFLTDLHSKYPGAIEFRVAETPVFVPADFRNKMIDTCESIIDFILDPQFAELTERAIPESEYVPNENRQSHFIAFDFGICENESGEYEPQLIEMQGFPTLFGFQAYYPEVLEKYWKIPDNYSHYFNGLDKESYIKQLKELIIGDANPEEVVLLEIKPHEQKTRIDFYCTEEYLGISIVCLTDLIREGRELFYMNHDKKVKIKRIYNRVIFDDLYAKKEELGDIPDITADLDVQWIPHPNWFYRISKFTLPFLNHRYIPKTYFLSEIKQLPTDLENYVLKPLFSFAGQGVVIDVKPEDIDKIEDPQNWILQRKVKYADVIQTPDIPAKAEIRLMYIWKDGDARPTLLTNLARLSKGKMIGVRYNKDKEWVGGSVCYVQR